MSTYQEILQKKYNDEYQKLNEKQRQAVDTIEGPVMVIAGPEPGKRKFWPQESGRFYWRLTRIRKIFYASLIRMPAL